MEYKLRFEKIDDHLYITLGCIKRIVHTKKELKKVASDIVDNHFDNDLACAGEAQCVANLAGVGTMDNVITNEET